MSTCLAHLCMPDGSFPHYSTSFANLMCTPLPLGPLFAIQISGKFLRHNFIRYVNHVTRLEKLTYKSNPDAQKVDETENDIICYNLLLHDLVFIVPFVDDLIRSQSFDEGSDNLANFVKFAAGDSWLGDTSGTDFLEIPAD
ncbi:hypothetical protein HI914_02261 [Erysiphe necator]|nr:hypothetical protein HI914_02261 [Erysiphe necator]